MRAATWVMKKLKKLWFLDESGVYLGMTCRYGWAATHMRVRDSVPTNYGTPWTMIAMIGVRGLHAPWLLEGAMHGDGRRCLCHLRRACGVSGVATWRHRHHGQLVSSQTF
jgi:hypothetical protein